MHRNQQGTSQVLIVLKLPRKARKVVNMMDIINLERAALTKVEHIKILLRIITIEIAKSKDLKNLFEKERCSYWN
jgi:hypothetical protein